MRCFVRCAALAWLAPLAAGCQLKQAPGQSTPNTASNRPPANVAPIHPVTSVPPPPVSVKSAPIPGFRRGINLANALDAPHEGAWGVVLSENHFQYVKEAGFDHIRLPARFSAHAQTSAPFTIDEKFFKRVDWAVDQAQRRGLSVLVDMHHYEEMMQQPDAHAERFLGMWAQIAARYQDRPATVAFELLNEPCHELSIEKWNALLARALRIVRATNPERLVVIDPYFWASNKHLQDLELPEDDPNLIPTFHMYEPILFTHQGAEWMEPWYQTTGVVFPGPPAEPLEPVPAARDQDWVRVWLEGYNELPPAQNPSGPKRVYEEFGRVTEYIEQTGRRVYMGEFGAVDHADSKSRANYLRLVREEADRRGIAWAYWDDGGRNKALDAKTGTWVNFIHDALLE